MFENCLRERARQRERERQREGETAREHAMFNTV